MLYNQQRIYADPQCAEAYGGYMENALKWIDDFVGTVQLYIKTFKLHSRFSDAHNNLDNA